ncbi:fibronectin type III domain-containing protein [Streptomyces sp. NPDC054958]
MTRATVGERVLRDDTVVPDLDPPPTPIWYLAAADGSPSVIPPHRRVMRGDPVPAGFARHREIQIMWKLMMGGIAKTPTPGGQGAAPVEASVGVRRIEVFIAGLPVPASGAVPVPVPPTVASLTIPDPTEASLVIGGYWTPGTPPAGPNWVRVGPATMYAIQLQAFRWDDKAKVEVAGAKSQILFVETPSDLPPADAYPPAPLATPSGLGLAPRATVPNPAGGAPGPFELVFGAVSGADGYEVYTNPSAHSAMGTPGLMAGDRLVGSAPQPMVVDSQQPVRVTTTAFTTPGELVSLKMRAVKNLQLGGKAYSPFSAPMTTQLLKTSAPSAPKNLRANGPATATSVAVQWDALGTATPPVAELRLFDKGVHRLTVPASATSAVVPGYAANDLYSITIRGVSTAGTGAPSAALTGRTAPA